MKAKADTRKQERQIVRKNKYQLYEAYKKYPDPTMPREVWIRVLSKELKF